MARSPAAAVINGHQIVEIHLISAQGLKPSAGPRRLQAYAVTWVDPAAKVRTCVDRAGGENPMWNDKFLFRVPAGFLAEDSSSAVSVEIYAAGGWYLPDTLVGTVRLLIGNLRLLSRRPDLPAFDAVGIRRPSGRFHGVLNVCAAILTQIPELATEALSASPAVGYGDLKGENVGPKNRRRAPVPQRENLALKELNREVKESKVDDHQTGGEEDDGFDAAKLLCVPCGLGLPRRIHLSPSDQNLQFWTKESPGR